MNITNAVRLRQVKELDIILLADWEFMDADA